ncbi:hypothetical protein R8Z50_19795 [Longispora sp. K20-0274]|uniref:hypothetical protein n=1 Tax=Longispora sp. K20-0274 TaxID=3088255 RepID=UPI00399BBA8F
MFDIRGVPALALATGTLALALTGDAVASTLVSFDPAMRSRMRIGPYGDAFTGTSGHERAGYLIAALLVLAALGYLAFGVAERAGRSGPVSRAALVGLTTVLALWFVLGETNPWSALGRWTGPPDGPGQFVWTPAVPGWYPPVSHVLFAVELLAAGAVLVLVLAGARRGAATHVDRREESVAG